LGEIQTSSHLLESIAIDFASKIVIVLIWAGIVAEIEGSVVCAVAGNAGDEEGGRAARQEAAHSKKRNSRNVGKGEGGEGSDMAASSAAMFSLLLIESSKNRSPPSSFSAFPPLLSDCP
jgi:hypothetical protein